MGKSILTIGIPTYNRREIVTSCLENLEKDSLLENLETLVIDSTASTEAGNGSGGRVADGQRSG